jgi:hypothetical protein
VEAGGDRGGTKDTNGAAPDGPGIGVDGYPYTKPITAADASSPDAPGEGVDAYPEVSPTLYGLSGGDNCYTITAIEPGSSDGCMLGVVTLTGQSLPMNYRGETGTVALGANGSLGSGVIFNNQGTLTRDGDTSFIGTTCTLHQTDTTLFQMLANDKFTVSVTEVESNFSPTCGVDAPAGGTCTSTWTWTMQRATDPMLVPPFCQRTP